MSTPERVAVILIGIACVVLGVYNAVTPDRNTVGLFGVESNGAHARHVIGIPSPGPMQVRVTSNETRGRFTGKVPLFQLGCIHMDGRQWVQGASRETPRRRCLKEKRETVKVAQCTLPLSRGRRSR